MSLAPITLRFDGLHAHGFALGHLVEPYPFDIGGVSGVIPAGYATDLESVPRVVQWMLPRAGRALRPAVIHDYLIATRGYSRTYDAVFMAALDLERFRDLRVYPIRWALAFNTWRRRNRPKPLESIMEEVAAILAGWTNIRVEDRKAFWLIAGIDPSGRAHAGTRADPISLARDLVELAKVQPAQAPVVVPEPEVMLLPPNPVEAKLSDFGPVGEPEAHAFADLIDATKDNEAERLRLRGRYLFLHHMLVDQSGGLPELSPSERVELNSLQTRNKASENWLDINV